MPVAVDDDPLAVVAGSVRWLIACRSRHVHCRCRYRTLKGQSCPSRCRGSSQNLRRAFGWPRRHLSGIAHGLTALGPRTAHSTSAVAVALTPWLVTPNSVPKNVGSGLPLCADSGTHRRGCTRRIPFARRPGRAGWERDVSKRDVWRSSPDARSAVAVLTPRSWPVALSSKSTNAKRDRARHRARVGRVLRLPARQPQHAVIDDQAVEGNQSRPSRWRPAPVPLHAHRDPPLRTLSRGFRSVVVPVVGSHGGTPLDRFARLLQLWRLFRRRGLAVASSSRAPSAARQPSPSPAASRSSCP